MLEGLTLSLLAPGRVAEEYRYTPYDYPSAIAGRVDEWLQAIPARSAFTIVARPGDFLAKDRPRVFANGSQLRLALVLPPPRPGTILLKYRSGTLTSNTCGIH
jgi:hypothetical protein